MANLENPLQSLTEPGIKAEGQLLAAMRREVANLLGLSHISFPGGQPVSFSRKHISALMDDDYYLCEKSDGMRYLLYLTENEYQKESHFFIDRRNDYWWLNNASLHFPLLEDQQRFHTRTLLDGELVMDVLPNGRKEPKFLIFDCLAMDGEVMTQKRLDRRLGSLQALLMTPYRGLFKQYPDELRYQPFTVELKAMQLAYGIEMMFREVLPSLKHGNDGLIFTCKNTKYKHGTDPHILKWKPLEENTIDCRLRLHFALYQPDAADVRAGESPEPYVDYDSVPRAELYVFVGNSATPPNVFFDTVFISDDEWETLKSLGDPLVDRIVECYKDSRGRWRIMRFRDDKTEANHLSTIQAVLESINNPVSEQDLFDAAKNIKDNWKARQQSVR